MIKQYNGPNLTDKEVLDQLEKIQSLGWDVYSNKKPNSYIIETNNKKIDINFLNEKGWFIVSRVDGGAKFTSYATNLTDFIRILNEASNKINLDLTLPQLKKSMRLEKDKPATNKIKLIELIKDEKISKIYDPYFDIKALNNLLSMNKLGLEINSPLQCLIKSEIAKKNDKNFINDVEKEMNIKIEIKIIASEKPHRRFIILENNKIIIIGCSLNNLDKNEVINEEIDKETSKKDLIFFESEWKSAKNFIL